MKIGFDAKRAFYNRRGLGTYSRTLIESLAAKYQENQYFLYSPKNSDQTISAWLEGLDRVTINHQSHFSNSAWRTFQLGHQALKDELDIYHGLTNEIPYRRAGKTKYVVTIHDLIFLKYPEFYPWVDRKIYYSKVKYAVRHSDSMICISENTRKDLLSYFDVPKSKIKVIQPACSAVFYQSIEGQKKYEVRNKYNLPQRFILTVGATGSNKNLGTLYEALSLLPDSYHLVVIGYNNQNHNEVNKLRSRIHFLDYLSEKELAVIYSLASITIYISLYEGFGLPVVESLATGTPVVASGSSAIPEALGPGGLLVDPKNSEEITESIKRIAEDSEFYHQLSDLGRQHSLQFQPDKKANEIIGLYQSLLN